MPKKDVDEQKPQDRPGNARKKSSGTMMEKTVGGGREARLAEALRANLRRRKSGAIEKEQKDD